MKTYKVLKDFNGRTLRFKAGAVASDERLADCAIPIADLVASGHLEDPAAKPASATPKPEGDGAASTSNSGPRRR